MTAPWRRRWLWPPSCRACSPSQVSPEESHLHRQQWYHSLQSLHKGSLSLIALQVLCRDPICSSTQALPLYCSLGYGYILLHPQASTDSQNTHTLTSPHMIHSIMFSHIIHHIYHTLHTVNTNICLHEYSNTHALATLYCVRMCVQHAVANSGALLYAL